MAARVDISVPDIGRLLHKLDGNALVGRRVRRMLRQAGNLVRAEMRRQVPRGTPTRRARGSGRAKVRLYRSIKLRMGTDQVLVRPSAFHSHMVEGGTQAHVIKPKKAKALKFGEFYRPTVKHPGAKAQPFIEDTRRASEPQVRALLDRQLAEIRREFDS